MIVTLVHVKVKEQHVNDFIAATKINHESSTQEPGNFRFDILQEESDPCKFVLYEAYETESHAAAHKQTSHYAHWRDKVTPWMAVNRQGFRHTMLFPTKR
jgi:autoinducer 2-degrading protein